MKRIILSISFIGIAVSLLANELYESKSNTQVQLSDKIITCEGNPQQELVTTQSISGYLKNLFNSSSYPDRWNCGSWSEFEGWFMIVSDFSIFSAYLSIPILLLFIFWKRKRGKQHIPFKNNLILFAGFILFCGFTHLIEVIIFWEPVYRFSGLVKFLTGVISWVTVASLTQALPLALSYKSPEELEKEIDQRKLVEENLKKTNEELDAFTYSVSHDLRAPLRAINGYANALQEDVPLLDNESQDYLKRIIHNASKMGMLIDNLIDLSRLNKTPGEYAEFSGLHLIHDIIESNPEFRNVEIDQESLPILYGDKSMLGQVFENLISNAVKYSSTQDNQKVTVYGTSTKKSTSITVKDNGVGFDTKYADKLFEVFQRLHTESEFDGTGIGLSLCKKIVDIHNGEIAFESAINEGSSFTVILPKKTN